MSRLEALLVKPLNHMLAGASWAKERLRRHTGAHVRMQAGPLLCMDLCIDGEGLFQAATEAVSPDVSIELPTDFPARMLVARDSLMASAKLSGSADIAETLAFVFRHLRWDVEADLAAVIGDIPARRLSLAGARLIQDAGEAAARVGENLAEYARDESGLLVASEVVQDFSAQVDALRDDLARLEKRLIRLGA